MTNSFYTSIINFKRQQSYGVPEGVQAHQFVLHLFETLFISKNAADNNPFEVRAQLLKLENQLQQLIASGSTPQDVALHQSRSFFVSLPKLFNVLRADALALLQADPAAVNLDEVLNAYPGFFAIAIHRFAHELFELNVPFIPRILSEFAHSKTGIDIHPGATIGERFVIDHGTGVVIGETAIIGNDVVIYQNVTLGALHVRDVPAQGKRHPTIGDRVVIYSGATILGPNAVVGHDSVIGGNVWLTENVESHSVITREATYAH
jgi:serine O-acetyltransferase